MTVSDYPVTIEKPVTVAIFLVDQRYGGPEEGGWWYYYGSPAEEFAAYTRGFATEDEALRYQASLAPVLAKLNEGRRDISSVLSQGIYSAELSEGNPKPFPDHRPHYE